MPMTASERLGRAGQHSVQSLRETLRCAMQGLVDIGHNSLALLGLACIGLVLFFSSDGALRLQIERQALEWLNLRHGAADLTANEQIDVLTDLAEPDVAGRAAAKSVASLPRDQAQVAQWLAKRYKVAPDAVARLVHESWSLSKKVKFEPSLILAIIAVESSFNPFAQSPVGAQGLMQVMTSVHDEKYTSFGGKLAAFDPVTNLRVGVQVLAECVAKAGGDVALGLKYYVGAANLPDDGGYAERVFFEQTQIKSVAAGQAVPLNVAFARSPGHALAVAVATPQELHALTPAGRQSGAGAAAPPAAAGIALGALAPAAHASAGTVMAPALGVALPVNLPAALVAPTAADRPAQAVQAGQAALPVQASKPSPATAAAPAAVAANPATAPAAAAGAQPGGPSAESKETKPKADTVAVQAAAEGKVTVAVGSSR